MSHVPENNRRDMARQAFEEGNLFKDIDHTNYGKGSRPYAVDGEKVFITGHLVPNPTFVIQWVRYGPGHIGQEPSGNRSHVVASRQLDNGRIFSALGSGRFALSEAGSNADPYLEVVPVEWDCIYQSRRPNWAWDGMWEVA